MEKVSVVVPHGGVERLAQLVATLASLRQCTAVGEILVAEMGRVPVAEASARRWADNYAFVRNPGAFERARALNVGSGLARLGLILWLDNDMIVSSDFIPRAIDELRQRQLDYLIPYTSVRYLSEADSAAVMHGTRGASDCASAATLYSGRRQPACSGGVGLVTREFLLRCGGLIEGFRGWGGEDNAWDHKVRLLGRAAATARTDQHAYHLFHPTSGGYGGPGAGSGHPHYAGNLALFRRIHAIRNPGMLLSEFPPHRSAPWDPGRRIAVLATADYEGEASVCTLALRSLYGDTVERLSADTRGSELSRWIEFDAAVVFGRKTARALFDDSSPELLQRMLVVADRCEEAGLAELLPGEVPFRSLLLPAAGLVDPEGVATAVAGTLSLIIAGVRTSAEDGAAERGPALGPAHTSADYGPIWTYWEGPCPDWIAACRSTLRAHCENVRVLGPQEFDQLRDRDRDIDLSHLGTAHRADFIRTFLLARYGGLWIDADCLVMKPLEPVLALLREHEFFAHRERSGYVSNAFIGARLGSPIASVFYGRVCDLLRARRKLGWTSLGSEPLTEILNRNRGRWYELPCEAIQPICWSQPGAFFVRGEQSDHEKNFDSSAKCYMLSNSQITRYEADHPGSQLMAPDTFFSMLLKEALVPEPAEQAAAKRGSAFAEPASQKAEDPLKEAFAAFAAAYKQHGDESLSGPGSCLAQTAELRQRLPLLIADLGIRSLLDAPCGDFHWLQRVELRLENYIGVDFIDAVIAENERRHGSGNRTFLRCDIREDLLPESDCILCRDCLVHLTFADIGRVLRNFKATGARYLLMTTFPDRRENRDTFGGEWRPLNFERPPFCFPAPLRLLNEHCGENGGIFGDKSLGLWRLSDVSI